MVPSRRRPRHRTALVASAAVGLSLALLGGPAAAGAASGLPAAGTDGPSLLTDPYLQRPTLTGVHVAWATEFFGERHLVLHGEGVDRLTDGDVERLAATGRLRGPLAGRVRVTSADTVELERAREDANSQLPDRPTGVVDREVWRHGAEVRGLRPGQRVPYRVLSVPADGPAVLSDVFSLAPKPRRGEDLEILLTSDHQSMPMTPANLQKVEETVDRVDAVLLAGDLVNVPDRASEWFDDARGGAFFPALQGRASRPLERDGAETTYTGGELIQHAPLYPVIGNHEVMGRTAPGRDLNTEYNAPVPRDVAERAYEARATEVNPTGSSAVRERWITDNSFNVDTYLDLFTLPDDGPGGELYWAETIGDVRVIGLYGTQIWRTPNVNANARGKYHEPPFALGDELEQGWGQHIFEPIDAGSEQLDWLADELTSSEFRRARYTVVLIHHGIHSLGDNISPPFTDPRRIEERGAAGELTNVRYEYPKADDHLVRDLKPMLQDAGVDLVFNGHSHLWNRFVDDGTHYLESSNVGNNYGAFHASSGRNRPVPPPPWDASNYTAQGDPAGLEPIVPNVAPLTDATGEPLPFVASNDITVFSILRTGEGSITSYAFDTRDPDSDVWVLDRFTLG